MSAAVGVTPQDLRRVARLAGWSLLALVATILLQNITLQVVAGQPLGATANSSAIFDYYNHGVLKPVLWIALPLGLAIVPFALAFREYLLAHTVDPALRVLVNVAVVLTLVELPLLIAQVGQQIGLVYLATNGEHAGGILGTYTVWHWVYNGVLEWVEAAWMLGFGIVAWRSGALPRWIAGVGIAAGILLVFNEIVAITDISQSAKGPTYVVFLLWMIATAVYLLRGGTSTGGAVAPSSSTRE